jgi:NAD(P) transhydrogenase
VKDRISVADLAFRVQAVVKRELEVVRSQLKRNDVTSLAGGARFLDPHTVEVSTETGPQTVTGEHILVACGTWPAHNPEIPLDGKRIVDSDQLLAAAEIPRELIVVGAGVIGLEYASMMTALNVKVTLIDQRPCPLEYDRRTEHASRRTLIAPSRTARGPVQPRSYLDGTAPSGVPRAESRPVCFYPSRTEYSPA